MPGGIRRRGSSRPIWEAIAAKVDPKTGKPLRWAPGKPVTGGEPCTAYIGPDGAGHYVKMVHNGIEYSDMQMICGGLHLLAARRHDARPAVRDLRRVEPKRAGLVPDRDHRGHPPAADPARPTRFFVDMVLDTAGQKGRASGRA